MKSLLLTALLATAQPIAHMDEGVKQSAPTQQKTESTNVYRPRDGKGGTGVGL